MVGSHMSKFEIDWDAQDAETTEGMYEAAFMNRLDEERVRVRDRNLWESYANRLTKEGQLIR